MPDEEWYRGWQRIWDGEPVVEPIEEWEDEEEE